MILSFIIQEQGMYFYLLKSIFLSLRYSTFSIHGLILLRMKFPMVSVIIFVIEKTSCETHTIRF